eukprot:11224793-Lingulodinium_polyedra.AAC.1
MDSLREALTQCLCVWVPIWHGRGRSRFVVGPMLCPLAQFPRSEAQVRIRLASGSHPTHIRFTP